MDRPALATWRRQRAIVVPQENAVTCKYYSDVLAHLFENDQELFRIAAAQESTANAGTRGFFGKGDMQKEFEEASFALKPGEISQVIQTASGLHLIERYVCDSSHDLARRVFRASIRGRRPVVEHGNLRTHSILTGLFQARVTFEHQLIAIRAGKDIRVVLFDAKTRMATSLSRAIELLEKLWLLVAPIDNCSVG